MPSFSFGGMSESEPCLRMAADEILGAIPFEPALAKRVVSAWLRTLNEGPRVQAVALATELQWVEWQWPWLDEWKSIFAREGIVPYLWGGNARLHAEAAKLAASEDLLDFADMFRVAELRDMLTSFDVPAAGRPRKKIDLLLLLESQLTPAARKELLESRKREALEEKRVETNLHRPFLLAHALTMRYYTLRKLSPDPGASYVLEANHDCLGEAYAVREFNAERLDGIPPLFPGDRCMMWDAEFAESEGICPIIRVFAVTQLEAIER